MPTTGLPAFEEPLPLIARDKSDWAGFARPSVLTTLEKSLPLVAGHRLIEQPLFSSGVVEVVVDDLVAERRPCHGRALELVDRLAQRRGNASEALVCVRVALEHRRRLAPVLDSLQAGGDHRRERQVRIRVRTRNPRLDPEAIAVADDPEPAGAVVVAPGERRRRPALRGVALVRVDVRGDEDRELAHVRGEPGEVPAEDLARP